jgi:hypothetical protein
VIDSSVEASNAEAIGPETTIAIARAFGAHTVDSVARTLGVGEHPVDACVRICGTVRVGDPAHASPDLDIEKLLAVALAKSKLPMMMFERLILDAAKDLATGDEAWEKSMAGAQGSIATMIGKARAVYRSNNKKPTRGEVSAVVTVEPLPLTAG